MLDTEQFDEKEAIRLAQSGDARQYGVLYDRYLPQIYRFVLVKVMNRQDAEDICHQVFLSAWQNIGKYKDMGHSFTSWLYRIARNAVIDFYRTRKQSTDINELAEVLPDGEDLSGDLNRTFDMEKVMEAMKQLTDEQREVVMLRFVEELDVRETAHAMNRSEGAVRILQHRALQSLKEILNTEEVSLYDGLRINKTDTTA